MPRILYLAAGILFGVGIAAALAAALNAFRVAAYVILAFGFALALFGARVVLRGIRWTGRRADLVALSVALLVALSAGALRHEYAQGQMDIGLYTNDAYTMASTGGRALHGPDDVLLPGYVTTPAGAHPSAMFGYPALGAFAALLFGYWGVAWVNAPLAFVTALAIYDVGRRVAGRLPALAGLVAYEASFLTVWFQRWTMTENASTAVFFVAASLVLALRESWNAARLLVLGATLIFGALARPEGVLLMVPVAFLLLPALLRRARADPLGLQRLRRASLLFIVLAGLVVMGLAPSLPRDYLAAGLHNVQTLGSGRPAADATDVPTTGPGPNWGDYALRFQWDSLMKYGISWFILCAAFGAAAGLLHRRRLATLLLLASPYALFIVMPPVTTFHPWFMRRLWIAFIPLALATGAATLARLIENGLPYLRNRPGGRAFGGILRVIAVGVAIVLSLQLLDQGQPFYANNESDGSAAATAWLETIVPPGSCLLADQDVVGYGIPLRYVRGIDVVPFFNDLPSSMLHAAEAVRTHPDCYLLRLNTTLPINALTIADTAKSPAGNDFVLHIRLPPRSNLRSYLALPPLEDGYAPLAHQLDTEVPPRFLLHITVRLTLLRLPPAAPLAKGVSFEETDWQSTPEGMLATSQNATLRIPLDTFSDVGRNRTGLSLAFVTPLHQAGTLSYGEHSWTFAETAQNTVGGEELHIVPLPAPIREASIRFGEGARVRAAYIG